MQKSNVLQRLKQDGLIANSIENLIIQDLNQTILYRSDCKEAMQKLIDLGVKVDLIYLDPPFNSNRVYNYDI